MRHTLRIAALILFALTLLPTSLSAQTYFIYENSCQEPGQKVVTQGINSTTPAQITHTPCAVTVYLHGTSNLATLFSTDTGTPLTNPFNSQSNGYYHFEVTVAGSYDIVLSNTTSGPPTTPLWTAPFTISGVQLGAAGGGGGGSPGGSTNDVQINAGGGTFGGTSAHFQYNPSTQTVTLNGTGGLNITTGPVDFSGAPHTVPNYSSTTANILAISCLPGWTAIATDGPNGQNYYTCGSDNLFHQYIGALPAAPGSSGQLIANVSGAYGVYTGLSFDSVGANLNVPGGLILTTPTGKPFSMSGPCPTVTPLGVSAVGQALIGWDVGCIPKISYNALGPYAIGLQSLIDYTYLKLDANNCLALSPSTGDIGICRLNTSVLVVMDPALTSTPSKLMVAKTYTSGTNYEAFSAGEYNSTLGAYYTGPEVGSLGGVYHPWLFGGSGPLNAAWGIQTNGTFACQTTNSNCDFGSITTTQMLRNIWQIGFHAESIIGPTYPVNSGGVQIGLVAAPTATNPIQALTATVSQTSGTLGIVGFLSNGTISSATIANGGSGYTGPSCSVSLPTVSTGVGATCTATQSGGIINSVTITNPLANSGYQSIQATTITITDANGTGAVILPVITATAGFAGIAQNGSSFSPIFDGTVVARDRVVISTSSAGKLHDSGIPCASPIPSSIKSYGCTQVAGTGAASYLMTVDMQSPQSVIMLAVTPSATTCPTGAATGSQCKDTITISPAMPDTSYYASCKVASITTGIPQAEAVLTADKLAGSFKVQVVNEGTSAAQVGTYDCQVTHQ